MEFGGHKSGNTHARHPPTISTLIIRLGKFRFQSSIDQEQKSRISIIFRKGDGLALYSIGKSHDKAWVTGYSCAKIGKNNELILGKGERGCGHCDLAGGEGSRNLFFKIMKSAMKGKWLKIELPPKARHKQRPFARLKRNNVG